MVAVDHPAGGVDQRNTAKAEIAVAAHPQQALVVQRRTQGGIARRRDLLDGRTRRIDQAPTAHRQNAVQVIVAVGVGEADDPVVGETVRHRQVHMGEGGEADFDQ